MAIYTTFFLCEPSELHQAFPGWKLPLPEPVNRTRVNPFTREEMTVETREPEWGDVDSTEMQMPEMGAAAIDGDDETYLHNRIPKFLQSKPHWCAKNLTSVELEPLVAAATGSQEQYLETPLYPHPSLSAAIQQFPNEFVARLKSADESTLNAIAEKWAAEMSTPDFPHSVSGERIQDDITLDEALSVVRPIADLATKHDHGQSMYVMNEW